MQKLTRAVIGFSAFIYLLETYLDIRQHRQYKITKLPQELAAIVEEEAFKKAQQYGLAKRYIEEKLASYSRL